MKRVRLSWYLRSAQGVQPISPWIGLWLRGQVPEVLSSFGGVISPQSIFGNTSWSLLRLSWFRISNASNTNYTMYELPFQQKQQLMLWLMYLILLPSLPSRNGSRTDDTTKTSALDPKFYGSQRNSTLPNLEFLKKVRRVYWNRAKK